MPRAAGRSLPPRARTDGMLLLYVPGHYLQMVDFCADHEPCLGLSFAGPGKVTPLPGQDPEQDLPMYVTHFESMSNFAPDAIAPTGVIGGINASTTSSAFGFAMYDCRRDIAYRFRFDEMALIDVFLSMPPSTTHVQGLHLALAHLQDPQLVLRIMRILCDTRPHYVTADILKEFLIGSTYMSLRSLKSDPALLRLIPVTSLPQLPDENEDVR